MTDKELYEKTIEIQQKDNISRDNFNRYLKNHYSELYNKILERTSFLSSVHLKGRKNNSVSLYERLYCIKNSLYDIPKCQHCKAKYVARFYTHLDEYSKWCSTKCQVSDPECINKSKKTRLELYGNENFNNMNKSRITRYKNYNGKWNPYDFKQKVKNTKKLRFGDENYVNVEKIKRTKLERYGDSGFNNMKKNYETKLKNHGDPYFNNRDKFKKTLSEFTDKKWDDIKIKREETNLKIIGVKYQTQSKDVQDKIKNTMITRYGTNSPLQLDYVRNANIELLKKRSLSRIHLNGKYSPLFSDQEFIENRNRYKYWDFKCNKCGTIFKSRYVEGKIKSRCPNCEPKKFMLSQTNLYNFIKDHSGYDDVLQNNHKILDGLEIDIVSEKGKFGIEYDGLYWHSIAPGRRITDKNYHLNKTELANSKGYKLIHITEDEWLENEKLCKGLLRRILNFKKYHISQNKCSIVELTENEKNVFISKYSFSGDDNSSIRIGLKYKNYIVSCITLMKKKDYWRILNYCTLNNFEITNDFNTMIDYFVLKYKPVEIRYNLDRRWFNDLNSNRFTLDNTTDVKCWYTSHCDRFETIDFTRKTLPNIIDNYDKSKTIVENLENNGYGRYYDCGNLVYIMKLK